jgi:hypothetical protein
MAAMGSFARTRKTKYPLLATINESQPLLRAWISLTLPSEDLPKSCPVLSTGLFVCGEKRREEKRGKREEEKSAPPQKLPYHAFCESSAAGGRLTKSNRVLLRNPWGDRQRRGVTNLSVYFGSSLLPRADGPVHGLHTIDVGVFGEGSGEL